MPSLAMIGMGGRVSGLLRTARSMELPFTIGAIVDPNPDLVRERLSEYGLEDAADAPIYANIDELLAGGAAFDAAMIGTRCNLHAPLAVELAQKGVDVPLFLEKPVAIDEPQLAELAQAYEGRSERVVVSFPLRVTPLFREVLKVVQSGRLGPINQVQARNNVSYGGVYYAKLYRDFDITGGLWLQKATHDFDYINALVGQPPIAVAAMHSQRVYGGDMPADLRCSECDKTDTCIESPQSIAKRGEGGGMGYDDHWCAFSESIKNQDAGSAMLMYQGGIHAAYTQNFVPRRSAHQRGANIISHRATLQFDWTESRFRVIDHHDPAHSVIETPVSVAGGHMGGDQMLLQNFLEIIRGEAESNTPLRDGLLSAAMCLAARKAATTWTYQPITTPDAPQPSAPLAPPELIEA